MTLGTLGFVSTDWLADSSRLSFSATCHKGAAQVEAVSSMWASSAPGSKVCRPDARSGVHWNFHTGVAEDGFVIDRWVEMMDFFLFFGCHCSHCHNNSVVTRTVGPVGQVCFAKRYTVTGTHRIKKVLVGLTHGYWLPVGWSCSRTCQDEPYRRLLMAIRRRCWRTKVSMEVEVVGTFVVAFLDKILVMEMKGFLADSG